MTEEMPSLQSTERTRRTSSKMVLNISKQKKKAKVPLTFGLDTPVFMFSAQIRFLSDIICAVITYNYCILNCTDSHLILFHSQETKKVAFSENKVMLCCPTTEIPGRVPEWAAGERVLQERPQHGTIFNKRHGYKWWIALWWHVCVYLQLEFLSVGPLSFVTDLGPKGS